MAVSPLPFPPPHAAEGQGGPRRRGHRMRRRDFIGGIYGGALALSWGAAAQQPGKVWRIGSVVPGAAEPDEFFAEVLEQRLADLGHVQGRDIVLVHQLSDPQPDKIAEAVSSLAPQVDLLVVRG